ncbi:MAG TPA: hypothetical protein VJ937_05250 [Salinivirga sp.]|uniref:hypothetical protein n=1 Tax=Salinivirga sp. TaxID=1970192 RepID=UPI002B478D10|nr:hypothetical protein [Salinivirga sp.]HKK58861.1 hypothetical protein [Salinivirga sp.]
MGIRLFFLALLSVFYLSGYGQCNNSLIDSCKAKLTETTYLKHFKVRFSKSRQKRQPSVANFSLYLNKGTYYRFTTANDGNQKGIAVIKLYDDFRLYGSNVSENGKQIDHSFGFRCNKTGIYYLTIKFKDGAAGCAAVMLSMKPKKKKYDWDDGQIKKNNINE